VDPDGVIPSCERPDQRGGRRAGKALADARSEMEQVQKAAELSMREARELAARAERAREAAIAEAARAHDDARRAREDAEGCGRLLKFGAAPAAGEPEAVHCPVSPSRRELGIQPSRGRRGVPGPVDGAEQWSFFDQRQVDPAMGLWGAFGGTVT
jgi:hypothetical protein